MQSRCSWGSNNKDKASRSSKKGESLLHFLGLVPLCSDVKNIFTNAQTYLILRCLLFERQISLDCLVTVKPFLESSTT